MKVLLSYGNYYNHGKNYQVKFVYENTDEIKVINKLIKSLSNKQEIQPYEEKFTKSKNNKPITVIGGTNISKDNLLHFITELIIMHNAKVIIGKQEFTQLDTIRIMKAIDDLRINISIKKGKYFGFNDCYYATFKYATDEQREEVSYDFNVNLTSIMAQNYTTENDSFIFPFIVDRSGNITGQNTGIIGGTNIPEQTLPFFITRFIQGYDAVVKIGNEKFKDNTDNKNITQALLTLNKGRSKKYKKEEI